MQIPTPISSDALVIGAGPAGLMAAETLASAGHRVHVIEGKPSIGRKFLMAGKSGLNLTKDEPLPDFIAQYGQAASWLKPMLAEFGPPEVQAWAQSLGQPIFTGSTGRVFPKAMKASPLLRAWLSRLDTLGVTHATNWRWQGLRDGALVFETAQGQQTLRPACTILALGGASWARLGSDGAWAKGLAAAGVGLAPFQPANMGFAVDWGPQMAPHFGKPVKSTHLTAGPLHTRGEWVISARGIEGGAIYTLSRALRDGYPLVIDLLPDLSHTIVTQRLEKQGKTSLSTHLRKALHLDPTRIALVHECARSEHGQPQPSPAARAKQLKALTLHITHPHPMDEAISTAGGIQQSSLTDGLELRARPGTFACGEMLDWEATTGGYLITACLATGRWAGQNAAQFLKNR